MLPSLSNASPSGKRQNLVIKNIFNTHISIKKTLATSSFNRKSKILGLDTTKFPNFWSRCLLRKVKEQPIRYKSTFRVTTDLQQKDHTCPDFWT